MNTDMNQSVKIYELPELLNYISDDHFFRQKTKKIYSYFYQNSSMNEKKRKSFLNETAVFTDDRSIQEIRNALGKMSEKNKDHLATILLKNTVSEESTEKLVHLLHQYATLCIEWNDLYLSVYDKVYYQKSYHVYKKLFDYTESLIYNPKEYSDPDQMFFFRISNVELYAKMGIRYSRLRNNTSLESWLNVFLDRVCENYIKKGIDNEKWMSIMMHFLMTIVSCVSSRQKLVHLKSSDWYMYIENNIEKFPIKIKFKWMDFQESIDKEEE